MLELLNFSHMTKSTISIESLDKTLLLTSCVEIMTSKHLYQNTYILTRPRVANFADIIKIATMFIKITFKDFKKLKELEAMH